MRIELIVALVAFGGVILGFPINYFIEQFRAKKSLFEALAEQKVAYFQQLWEICDSSDLPTATYRLQKLVELHAWYNSGGGLVLSFKATQRFVWAKALLEESLPEFTCNGTLLDWRDLAPADFPNVVGHLVRTKAVDLDGLDLEVIKEQFSWLRTELKHTLGTYSRFEAKRYFSQIPGSYRAPKVKSLKYGRSPLVRRIDEKMKTKALTNPRSA